MSKTSINILVFVVVVVLSVLVLHCIFVCTLHCYKFLTH